MEGRVFQNLTLDVYKRWNSTYDMLSSALPYKAIFARMDISQGLDLELLNDNDWKKIEVLASYLKEFYALTKRISGSLYVTSNFMIFHIAHIVKVLDSLAANEDPTLQLMASEMLKKCNKYWGSFDQINMLMFIPAILDPSHKLRGLIRVLRRIFTNENVDHMVHQIKNTVFELFNQYKACFSNSVTSNPPSWGENEYSIWLEEWRDDTLSSGNLDGGDEISDGAELNLYFQERIEANELSSKYLLRWWKLNGPRYPIISRTARDVFAIPIITVSSESTFST